MPPASMNLNQAPLSECGGSFSRDSPELLNRGPHTSLSICVAGGFRDSQLRPAQFHFGGETTPLGGPLCPTSR